MSQRDEAVPGDVTLAEVRVRFPDRGPGLDQDEEWFEVCVGGQWSRFRLHDYASIFQVPGLYEAVVYDALECRSPREVAQLIADTVPAPQVRKLRVLDLGAGNGIVGEELREIGVRRVVGVDILREAAQAAQRDRPAVYDDYLVEDLCAPTTRFTSCMSEIQPNMLITVAALGFGDIPPRALIGAIDALTTPAWVAVTIQERFLAAGEPSGFARLLRDLIASDVLAIETSRRIRHRRSISGEPLFYTGLVGRKLAPIPSRLKRD